MDPARAAATTTGASVARGGLWNLTGNLLPQLYLLVVSIAAARFLGPDRFGRQSFIAFVELSLAAVLGAGLAAGLGRYVGASLGAGRGGEVHTLDGLARRLAWAASGVAALILVTTAVVGAEPQAAWILAGAFAAASILQSVRNAILVGFQRWREVTIRSLVAGAITTVAVVVVLALGGGITGMFAVEVAGGIVLFAWTAQLARRALRTLGDEIETETAPTRRMLRYAGITTINVILTLVIWRRSAFFFLANYSTDAQIGFYSISFAIASALLLIPASFTGVLLPSISTLHGAGELARIRAGYTRAARLLVMLALPLTAGVMALGPRLIDLVYGSTYGDAGLLLVILLIPAPVSILGNLAATLLAATERLVVPVVIGAVAAALNIGLDFALIPRYDDVGAAIATDAAQVAASLPVILYVRSRLGPADWKPLYLGKAVLSSAAAGLVAWGCVLVLDGVAGFLVGIASGIVVFMLLAGALRMLSADDAQWLDGAIGGALGGRFGKVVRFCS